MDKGYTKVGELAALKMDSAARRLGDIETDEVARWVAGGASIMRTLSIDLDAALAEIEVLKTQNANLKLDIIARDQSLVALKEDS